MSDSRHEQMKKTLVIHLLLLPLLADAQILLSLNKAIELGKRNSYSAKMADFTYMNSYWSYRKYKAAQLPSLTLGGSFMNYNRSIVDVRNYETGHVSYVDNNSLYNELELSVNQNLPWADGTLSLRSDISRLDQFDYNQRTYNSMPLLLYYNQPLRSFSNMKWRKKIEPLQHEQAKRKYLESMQDIAINVTSLFFQALSAQSELERNKAKFKDLTILYQKTEKKLSLGLVKRNDLLQLELSMLNAQMSISYGELSLENALFNLFSYLHIDDYKHIKLITPATLPDIFISTDDVTERARNNSSYPVEQHINILTAERNLAQTKANTGLQVSLQAQIGLTQTANRFGSAYKRLKDNEIVGITFSMPIFDWGEARGSIRMAKAQLELERTRVQLNEMEFVQDIRTKVMNFNSQQEQCKISKRALEIAEETYRTAYKLYENGTSAITELNTANSDLENAQTQYLLQLNTYWSCYFSIQRLTLYDYINERKIDCDFDNIIK